MSTLADDLAASLGRDIESEVIAVFKDKWSSISDDDRAAVRRMAIRCAELMIEEKAGRDVSANLPIVQATIANWKAAGQVELYDAFNNAVAKVAGLLGTFAGRLIKAAFLP